MATIKLKGPWLNDWFAEQLVKDHGPEGARAMGANGGHAVDAERLAFEAWMRGHCWALCATWTGTQYRSDDEASGYVNPHAMRTRQLWAAWRDRAANGCAVRVQF